MFDRIRNDEGGFTLIELLVVILIVGILAAIALPSFLGQQSKGKDASAKSNARNAVSQVESCLSTPNTTLADCDSAAELGATGLNVVAAAAAEGDVAVTAGAATDSWKIDAMSADGRVFSINKVRATGVQNRSCTVPGGADRGGCPANGAW